MRYLILAALVLALPVLAFAQQGRGASSSSKLFTYPYTIDDLPNGLRLVTVPTDYPNLVSLYVVVSVGSRNEIEAGKSGFAHFFEHMMFRGSENYTPEQREEIFKRAGAETNAYTSDDRTVYHATFSKEDLDEIMKVEADRFQHLKYSPDQFKTESKAVKGEYDKNSANPFSKMHEVLRETAFNKHTYSHTTMGYLKDIEDMPNQYDYSKQFFQRFYRPEYATVLIVGDITRERALDLTKRYWGTWQRGNYKADIPDEPAQKEARTAHIPWDAPTLPHLAIAFHAPKYSDTNKEMAALDLFQQVAFGENSDIYQQLVLKEQKVDVLEADFEHKADPELFTVFARIKDPAQVTYVRDAILKTLERYKTELIDQAKLDATRSRTRYGFAMQMNSNDHIADALAPYIALERTPETLNRLFDTFQRVTPEDIRDTVRKYFREESRTVVTLATKGQNIAALGRAKGGRN
ncbi:MAG: zinc protease [Acidobacteriota bacterium]|nr:zinc protease [Acidobacteriota bacterium]MDT7807255.1 zinc protease [Acidobacteriota bacterium]